MSEDSLNVTPIPSEESNASQITTMEVHHHPQLEHKPKPWKEYILEYIMIVLAVTTGFFAESLREHIGDSEKERQYMESLVLDLKYDVLNYDSVLQKAKIIVPIIDSLYFNINNLEKFNGILEDRWNSPVNNTVIPYKPVMTTIVQLKNSGNLRLVHNQKIVRAIVEYEYAVTQNLNYTENLVNIALADFFKLEDMTCDYSEFSKDISFKIQRELEGQNFSNRKTNTSMKVLAVDKNLLLRLANSTINYKGLMQGHLGEVIKAKQQAVNLINLIEMQYKIGKE